MRLRLVPVRSKLPQKKEKTWKCGCGADRKGCFARNKSLQAVPPLPEYRINGVARSRKFSGLPENPTLVELVVARLRNYGPRGATAVIRGHDSRGTSVAVG